MQSSESEQLRRQMVRIRNELSEDVSEVVEHAKALTDWQQFVRRHPWLCVGAAAAVGYLVVPSRLKARSPASAMTAPPAMSQGATPRSPVATTKQASVVNPLISAIAGVMIRSAVAVAADRLQNVLISSAKHRDNEFHGSGP